MTPTANDAGATITVNGENVGSGIASGAINLAEGDTTNIAIKVTAADATTSQTYTIAVSRAASSDATLSNLVISEGDLSPVFDAGTLMYMASVDSDVAEITVTPTANDDGATITVAGSSVASGEASTAISLTAGGDTDITIEVTAADGTIGTYTIAVSRAAVDDASLSDLVVSEGTLSPAFDSGTEEYTVSVENSVASLTVTPTATDGVATITVGDDTVANGQPSGAITLTEGDVTNIAIKVVAADDTTSQTYTIAVSRAASSDATLSNLVISEGNLSPAFDSGTEEYAVSVANSVASLTVTPTANDAGASITVNGENVGSGIASGAINLAEGDTTNIAIKVTAADEMTSQTYTIAVTRAASSDATLSSLVVSEGDLMPVFDAETLMYMASVDSDVAEITVTPTANDDGATITVAGSSVASGDPSSPISLTAGAETDIAIKVIAADSMTSQTYTIAVSRAAVDDATLSNLVVSEGTLSPAFDSGTEEYTVSVENSVASLTVTPTATDGVATITVGDDTVANGQPSGAITLTEGDVTNIAIKVVAADDTTSQTYTIAVSRAASSDATLSNLVVSEGVLDPVFDADELMYEVSVANSVASLTVTPTANDAGATITVAGAGVASGDASNAISLTAGTETDIAIKVIAADGMTSQTYTIAVSRAASSDATLSNLVVSEGVLDPVFDADDLMYEVSVANSTATLTVTPTANDAGASITVDGTGVTSGEASNAISLTAGAETDIAIKVIAADGMTSQTYTIAVSRAASSDATLSNLVVSEGDLSPVFDSGTPAYMVSVDSDVDEITVTPTANDDGATITVAGSSVASGDPSDPISLTAGGDTDITIEVTAADGTIGTYTIAVSRASADDATLSNLVVSEGTLSPAFDSGTEEYMVSVANSIATLTVTPTATDGVATITVDGDGVTSGEPSDPITLAEDDVTNIAIKVVAADDATSQTYTIAVSRAASSDATLSNLVVSEGVLDPVFDADELMYEVSVENSVETLTVTPTANNAGATITVNDADVTSDEASNAISLTEGDVTNIAVKVVAADDATSQTYTIAVSRAASSDATLSNLVVSEGVLDPAFDSGTEEYMVSVANSIATLTVTPTANNAEASITVNGAGVTSGEASNAISLTAGDVTNIAIKVVAADGMTSQTYTIAVSRAASSDATLSNLVISEGVLDPAFDTDELMYEVSVNSNVANVTVTPTASDDGASITVDGTDVGSSMASNAIPLTEGDVTNIAIKVVAADDITSQTYTIAVTRAANGDASLSNLVISSGDLDPVFDSGTLSYRVSVENNVETITVTPTATDGIATITVNGNAVTTGEASTAISLAEGVDTDIVVVVTSADSSNTETYTITVNRMAAGIFIRTRVFLEGPLRE